MPDPACTSQLASAGERSIQAPGACLHQLRPAPEAVTHRDLRSRIAGTALLRAHHATLDAAGTPAYLEASSDRNRVFYLRHGYADLGPPIRLPDGPPMRPMMRATGP